MTHIAILETDTPMPPVAEKHGSYGDQFKRLLLNAQLDPKSILKKYDVVTKQEYPPDFNGLDAILITGSKHNAYDNEEWIIKLVDFTKKAVDSKVKVVGICFGHQIVARALGSPVIVNDKGWELSSTPINPTPRGKELFPQLKDGIYIMEMHRDIVPELPQGTELLFSTETCYNQGFYKKDSVLTFQGHPEYNDDIIDKIVQSRYEMGILTSDQAEDAHRRSRDRNDGPILAKAIVKFILQGLE